MHVGVACFIIFEEYLKNIGFGIKPLKASSIKSMGKKKNPQNRTDLTANPHGRLSSANCWEQ